MVFITFYGIICDTFCKFSWEVFPDGPLREPTVETLQYKEWLQIYFDQWWSKLDCSWQSLDAHNTVDTASTRAVWKRHNTLDHYLCMNRCARWGFELHFVALPLSLPTHLSTAMIKKFFSLKNLPGKKKVSIIPPLLNIEFIIMSPAL